MRSESGEVRIENETETNDKFLLWDRRPSAPAAQTVRGKGRKKGRKKKGKWKERKEK